MDVLVLLLPFFLSGCDNYIRFNKNSGLITFEQSLQKKIYGLLREIS